jgi:hypothetical protein
MYNKNELYKLALYLTCNNLDLKLSKFMGKYFTLSDKSMCEYYILSLTENLINISYKTIFGACGLHGNGCNYYIFIRPYHKKSSFLKKFEFLLVDTSVILKLTDKFVMHYYQNIRGFMKSYYRFEYKTLQKNGYIMKNMI